MLLKAKSLGDPDFANYPRMTGSHAHQKQGIFASTQLSKVRRKRGRTRHTEHCSQTMRGHRRASDHAAARVRSLAALCGSSLHPWSSYGAGDSVYLRPPPNSSSS